MIHCINLNKTVNYSKCDTYLRTRKYLNTKNYKGRVYSNANVLLFCGLN